MNLHIVMDIKLIHTDYISICVRRFYLLRMLKGFMCEVHISCIFVCVFVHMEGENLSESE